VAHNSFARPHLGYRARFQPQAYKNRAVKDRIRKTSHCNSCGGATMSMSAAAARRSALLQLEADSETEVLERIPSARSESANASAEYVWMLMSLSCLRLSVTCLLWWCPSPCLADPPCATGHARGAVGDLGIVLGGSGVGAPTTDDMCALTSYPARASKTHARHGGKRAATTHARAVLSASPVECHLLGNTNRERQGKQTDPGVFPLTCLGESGEDRRSVRGHGHRPSQTRGT